jgi:hypothetical protein
VVKYLPRKCEALSSQTKQYDVSQFFNVKKTSRQPGIMALTCNLSYLSFLEAQAGGL